MSDNDTPIAPNATGPDTIDVQSDAALEEWAKKLDTTTQQLKDAVAEVGDRATDVEMHLKGTRSTTNTERVEEAGGTS
jgi:phosphoserine phosphatase